MTNAIERAKDYFNRGLGLEPENSIIRDLLAELEKANKVVDEQHELIKLIFSDLKMRTDEDGTLNLSDFIVLRIIEALSNYRSDKK